MSKLMYNKKYIIITLMLFLMIVNFSIAFAYWPTNSDQTNVNVSMPVGEWDFEDTALVVLTYRSDHAFALSLTESTVTINDKTAIQTALAEYGLLSIEAKAQLTQEETLLLSLLNEIIALENSEYLDFESDPYDSGLTGTVEMNGRTWYGSGVYISNDSSYDVWNDTRALSLSGTAYFESQDLFINGIDKITLYHGALNFGNGTDFQFQVEYELGSNPGVWQTLQDGGSDLLIDIVSSTPLSFTEIDVNITEAVNIRFSTVIEGSSGYLCLDDIRIYEHIVSGDLEATTFRTVYASALGLTVETVETSDKTKIEQALAAFDLLSLDAQNALITEKALLDSLLAEINILEDIAVAEAVVIIAENSNLQIDVDQAQTLVTALPNRTEKTALQNRLDIVQEIIDSVALFLNNHGLALALTVENVTSSDQTIVEAALTAYESLSTGAKVVLTTEKALLDSLLTEINNQIPTATQVAQFQSNHAAVLALTVETVTLTDRAGVQAALAVYESLSVDAKAALTTEKSLLDSLLAEINIQEAETYVVIAEGSQLQTDVDNAQVYVNALPSGVDKVNLQDRLDAVQYVIDTALIVANFRSNHATVLSLTEATVMISDKTSVETVLAAYGLLSEAAKSQLAQEEALLLSLLNQIIGLENSEYLDFESDPYDSGLTGTVEMNGRTWYGSEVYISNDSNYDVWNDTRALSLSGTAYFESQDLFINGIDKITLYHGALNYGNGRNLQFKVEYELDSNPGVWLTLQDGGSDLLIDIISSTPLSYTEIDVNITEAVNIRFSTVVDSSSDYICLDDIRIYEHVVSSNLEVTTFRTVYAGALALTVETVEISDKATSLQALAAFDLLSIDAQDALTAEKALLDSLLVEINLQEEMVAAEAAVVIAEGTNVQTDVDSAQILVTALPSGAEKTALQDRLDAVQEIIDSVTLFLNNHTVALALTVETVTPSDQTEVETALTAYESLSLNAKTVLSNEKALLDSLLSEIYNQIPTATQIAEFRSDHAAVLALTLETVTLSDRAGVQTALTVYESLSIDAKSALTTEKALLDSLLIEINLQEVEAYVIIAEGSHLQIDVDNAQVYIDTLPDTQDKTDLQDRLDAVQDLIDILAAVAVNDLISALPNSGDVVLTDQTQIEAARTAYTALTSSQKALVVDLTALTSAEAELLALQLATDSVVIAENSNLQVDLNSAQVLVTALLNGQAKTALQDRLDAVQDIIDLEAAKLLILNYFESNSVEVKKFNNATAIKETAFLSDINEVVDGLNVTITITNTDEVDRRNTTYTIDIIKNGATITVDVEVSFTR